jgi:hypothetical protein
MHRNTKLNYQKLEAYFLGNSAASIIEKARFCTNFLLLKHCAKLVLDPELEPEPEAESEQRPEPKPGKNFFIVGTGTRTAINHYSTVEQHWFKVPHFSWGFVVLYLLRCLETQCGKSPACR